MNAKTQMLTRHAALLARVAELERALEVMTDPERVGNGDVDNPWDRDALIEAVKHGRRVLDA